MSRFPSRVWRENLASAVLKNETAFGRAWRADGVRWRPREEGSGRAWRAHFRARQARPAYEILPRGLTGRGRQGWEAGAPGELISELACRAQKRSRFPAPRARVFALRGRDFSSYLGGLCEAPGE